MAIKKTQPLDENSQRFTPGVQGEDRDNERTEPTFFNEELAYNDNAENARLNDFEQDAALTVGERLRFERERKECSLHEMAEIIRLRPMQIQALEEGDYDKLPGQAFVVGFLRSYANALGLDAVAIVDLYKKEHAGELATPQLTFPEPTSQGRMPGAGLLVGTCLIAALAFSGWYFYQNSNKDSFEIVSDLPNRFLAKLENTSGASEAVKGDEISSAGIETSSLPSLEIEKSEIAAVLVPGSQVEKSEQSGAGQSIMDDVLPSSTMENTAPQSPEPKKQTLVTENNAVPAAVEEERATLPVLKAQEPTSDITEQEVVSNTSVVEGPSETPISMASAGNAAVDTPVFEQETLTPPVRPKEGLSLQEIEYMTATAEAAPESLGVQNSDARIVLMALQEVWVQILTAGKEIVLERILGPGDTFMVPSLENLTLSTANAAGLEIRLDGQALSSLGGYGAIVHELELNPESLKERFSVSQ